MEFSQCPCDVAVNRLKACRQTKTSGEYFLPTMYLPFLLPCLPIPLTHTHTHTHTDAVANFLWQDTKLSLFITSYKSFYFLTLIWLALMFVCNFGFSVVCCSCIDTFNSPLHLSWRLERPCANLNSFAKRFEQQYMIIRCLRQLYVRCGAGVSQANVCSTNPCDFQEMAA